MNIMNTLTTVYKNGIVNHVNVCDDPAENNGNHTQLIWNGTLQYYTVGLNSKEIEDKCMIKSDIKDYRAIYFNGIMVVKNGKVWPRQTLKQRFFGAKY